MYKTNSTADSHRYFPTVWCATTIAVCQKRIPIHCCQTAFFIFRKRYAIHGRAEAGISMSGSAFWFWLRLSICQSLCHYVDDEDTGMSYLFQARDDNGFENYSYRLLFFSAGRSSAPLKSGWHWYCLKVKRARKILISGTNPAMFSPLAINRLDVLIMPVKRTIGMNFIIRYRQQ